MRARTVILLEIAMVLCSYLVLAGPGYSDATLPNPHSVINNEVPCLDCHDSYRDEVDEHEFIVGVSEICEDCHDFTRLGRSHPYDVSVADSAMEDIEVPDSLPLVGDSMTCGSCHDPHMAYLSTVRSFRGQYAEEDFRDDYYQTYFARLSDPEDGWDPLCVACHPKY